MLGCLDECDDSALWFLSQIQRLIEKEKSESPLRIVIVTTKGTPKDKLIADALSKFPNRITARMDYTPPDLPFLQAGFELSMLVQEYPRYATGGLQDAARDLILTCANDEKMCRMLVEVLKSNHDYPNPVPDLLLEFSETRNLDLIFHSILDQVPRQRKDWVDELLSWVLMSFRPLRASEFCRIAELCFRRKGKTSKGVTGMHLYDILWCFKGMLVLVDGEVKPYLSIARSANVSEPNRQTYP